MGCWSVQPWPSSSKKGHGSGSSHLCTTYTQSSPSWLSQAPASCVPHTLPACHQPHCHQDEETEDPTKGHGKRGLEQSSPLPRVLRHLHAARPPPVGGPKGMTSEVPLKEGTQVFPSPVQRAFILFLLLRELWGERVLLYNKISVFVREVTK